jgi:hypothetical protein
MQNHYNEFDIFQATLFTDSLITLNNYMHYDKVIYSHTTHIQVSQNLCHKLFLGTPHPHLSKKVPINMGPKVNRFRDIDLRSCAGIEYHIRCSEC